jgi:hypothetical protein
MTTTLDREMTNEEYCKSPEWLELLEKASKAVLKSYTIIYRDTDDCLKESWHHLSDMNIEYVQNKYKQQKKEILYFEPKTLDFGQRLNQITGNSKVAR